MRVKLYTLVLNIYEIKSKLAVNNPYSWGEGTQTVFRLLGFRNSQWTLFSPHISCVTLRGNGHQDQVKKQRGKRTACLEF